MLQGGTRIPNRRSQLLGVPSGGGLCWLLVLRCRSCARQAADGVAATAITITSTAELSTVWFLLALRPGKIGKTPRYRKAIETNWGSNEHE
jgi:hypothetical protein